MTDPPPRLKLELPSGMHLKVCPACGTPWDGGVRMVAGRYWQCRTCRCRVFAPFMGFPFQQDPKASWSRPPIGGESGHEDAPG